MEEIKNAKEIGRAGSNKYIYHTCVKCGKERWVKLYKGKARNVICEQCNARGEGNPNWKGKGGHDERGYIRIYVTPNDFFYPMAIKTGKGAYLLGHRLAMAKHLGRNLHTWEQVHHKNRIKDDNRIENLQLCNFENHNPFTVMQAKIDRLKARIKVLEEEKKTWKKQKALDTV